MARRDARGGRKVIPAALRAARETLGLGQAEFALALGYQNHDRQGLRQQVNDMEAGRKSITPQTGRLAEMFRRFGVPPGDPRSISGGRTAPDSPDLRANCEDAT
jgi:transcriptional regulator with XRE-family HTH domain